MSETWDANKVRIEVARDLREVGSLYLDLWAEVEYHAADREMPGGDAMNMLGPAANLEAWEHRYEAAESKATDDGTTLPEYVQDQLDTETHPLLVLATWEDAIREERDQPTDLKATVPRAIDYIRGSLDWCLRVNEYDEPEWLAIDQMAREIRDVKAALESVLSAGHRSDRGADCLTCGTALVHIWTGSRYNPKRLEDDFWRCGPCDVDVPYPAYMKAVEEEYLKRATWLQANHIEAHYKVPLGTLKSWVNREHVAKRVNVNTGRVVYRVRDVIERLESQAAA